MPHGQADFGMYAVKETVGSMADVGELAARLGSIVTLDRRGDVIFLEDFEAPILNWTAYSEGGGHEERLYPDRAYSGSQCLALTTGAVAGNLAGIVRRFHATPNQCYGIEARLLQPDINGYYDIEMWIYNGIKYYKGEWRYDSEGKELLIWDSTGHWKAIATGIKAASIRHEWWPMKLVVDSLNWEYVRGLFLGVEYDLSDEAMEEDTSDVAPCISPAVEVTNQLGAASYALFDNIILTQNEP